jgi:hypothetical protein
VVRTYQYLRGTCFFIFSHSNMLSIFITWSLRFPWNIITLYMPRWRSWLRHCATNRKVAGSITDDSRFFHWHNPGVDSASNRNEYQEYFLGLKAANA